MLSSDAANVMSFTKGFTLLEVLVAMTILSVGIVGVLGGFSLSIRAGSRAMLLNEAVDIAQREFELLSTVPAADMLPSSGSSGRFSWQVVVSDRPGGLVLASIQVTWMRRGQSESYKLSQVFLPHRPEENMEE